MKTDVALSTHRLSPRPVQPTSNAMKYWCVTMVTVFRERSAQPYDEDIRVPMIVRGPGVEVGKTTNQIALNIDLVSCKLHQMLREYVVHADADIFRPGWFSHTWMTWMECH